MRLLARSTCGPTILGAGVVLVLGALPMACQPQSSVLPEDVAEVCSGCETNLARLCVADLVRRRDGASAVGCAGEYDAWFSCVELNAHAVECQDATPDACRAAYDSLTVCVHANDADNECDRAEAHVKACTGDDPVVLYDGFCHTDAVVHRAECFAEASCADLQAYLHDGPAPPTLVACLIEVASE